MSLRRNSKTIAKILSLITFLCLGFYMIATTSRFSHINHEVEINIHKKLKFESSGNVQYKERDSGNTKQALAKDIIHEVLGKPRFVNVTEFLKEELGASMSTLGKFECRSVGISTVNFPICLYNNGEDKWVSSLFRAGSYWENTNVLRLILFTKRISKLYNDKIGFIDIGANLGGYTLPFAHLGYDVLAIEPNKATATRLATALYQGKVTHKVRLLRNAVSDKREIIHLNADITNRGDTHLEDCVFNSSASMTVYADTELKKNYFVEIRRCLNDSVSTVLMDDLVDLMPHRTLIMKIDIQGAEEKALNPKTSSKFFSKIYIPIIFMEWEFFGAGNSNIDEKTFLRQKDWINFFVSMNYTAHKVNDGARMGVDEWLSYKSPEVILIKTELAGTYRWSL